MAYQTPITIKSAIDHIRKRHYVLPSIQREFVWTTEQIEQLFDSLMRDYPISTFLFWKVDKHKIKDFQFYEFLNKYHEKDNRHNRKADLMADEDVIALLDGQQRMTSMYISLTGSYTERKRYYKKTDASSYVEKKLYLNLLAPSDELETEYDFSFLTAEEAQNSDGYFWFDCTKILEMSDVSQPYIYLIENDLTNTAMYTRDQSIFSTKTLTTFFNVVHQKGTISYYQEEGEELDKVLQIFIRINSGGTKLSYSDLLLSIATAQWQEKDAREVIHAFVDELNRIGDGFAFNKDLVLKACLVLADFKDIKFKVDNFNRDNMMQIEHNWDKTSLAIRSAIELVAKLGYNRDTLTATNAVIPIAYFIYKNGYEASILHSVHRQADRKAIAEWLARVLIKGTFGGQPDSIYPKMRDLVNDHIGHFPLQETVEHYKGGRKSISFTEDDIDSLLDLQYGQAKTHSVLALLYPGLNRNFKYHQDHIHPKSLFEKRKMRSKGFAEDEIEACKAQVNCLANLQLLEGTQNIEKSNTSFVEWLKKAYPVKSKEGESESKKGESENKINRDSFLRQHYISVNEDDWLFQNFLSFVAHRRQTLKKKLSAQLGASTGVATGTDVANL